MPFIDAGSSRPRRILGQALLPRPPLRSTLCSALRTNSQCQDCNMAGPTSNPQRMHEPERLKDEGFCALAASAVTEPRFRTSGVGSLQSISRVLAFSRNLRDLLETA